MTRTHNLKPLPQEPGWYYMIRGRQVESWTVFEIYNTSDGQSVLCVAGQFDAANKAADAAHDYLERLARSTSVTATA